ncbi:MAG: phosphatidate cytidylyltransferase [Parafilimonas sp.]|nr:phosphatidate cytidylyltransferase [Parafilimonas sp.]
MTKLNVSVLAFFLMLLTSCQAIGDIFSAGVWIGMTIVIVVIIILVLVFRRKS